MMITDYEAQHEDADFVPNVDREIFNAKLFLLKASNVTGENLYDHLTEVLNKIFAERPENVIDFFEEYSRKVKERRFRPADDHLEDIYVPPEKYQFAKKIIPMLKNIKPDEPSTVDPADLELADMTQNNMMELLYYLEQAGIGLPRTEMYCITLSMRKLIYTQPIESIRFWGKIFGRFKNYIVLEAQLKDEEYMKRTEQIEAEKEKTKAEEWITNENDANTKEALEKIKKEQEEPGESQSKVPRPLPSEPVNQVEEQPDPPDELPGIGVNRKVFFVCNEIGEPWVQLPDATPKQIRTARQIYVAFTGNLDQDVLTYPEFPGKEQEYLRAQIARISAASQISPLGYYTFGEGMGGEGDEEDEEAAAGDSKTDYKINPKYDPVRLKDLLDNSMSFWVHHTPYILPQGRITWWNPNPMPEVADEELGEEEEADVEPKVVGAEPETGPALLTPCSEDATLETMPPWSVRPSSSVMEEYAMAIVRSNLWPGAYAFSTQGKIFQNVYMGNGLKYMQYNFSPLPLPFIQQDYPIGPEILEITDPTGAEEEQWRIDHLPKPKPPPPEGEGEEPEEEEEEDEEDED